jgi:hypothetical protein
MSNRPSSVSWSIKSRWRSSVSKARGNAIKSIKRWSWVMRTYSSSWDSTLNSWNEKRSNPTAHSVNKSNWNLNGFKICIRLTSLSSSKHLNWLDRMRLNWSSKLMSCLNASLMAVSRYSGRKVLSSRRLWLRTRFGGCSMKGTWRRRVRGRKWTGDTKKPSCYRSWRKWSCCSSRTKWRSKRSSELSKSLRSRSRRWGSD